MQEAMTVRHLMQALRGLPQGMPVWAAAGLNGPAPAEFPILFVLLDRGEGVVLLADSAPGEPDEEPGPLPDEVLNPPVAPSRRGKAKGRKAD
jgi:hypothetical protein